MTTESPSIASTLNRMIETIDIDRVSSCEKILNDRISVSPGSSDENAATAATWTRPIAMRSTESGSSEVTCRICYDNNPRIPILFPCRCKGTMGAIHLSCLERWLEESNRKSCELCGHEFIVERTLRYRAMRSIVVWLFTTSQQHQLYVRNLRLDVSRCLIVTPVTIVCSYVCIVAADFYSTNNYNNFPPARWTTYSLLTMMTVLIITYFLWMYTVMQYHQRVWFYWWQKTSIVRVKLPTMIDDDKISKNHNLQIETSV